MIKQCVSTLVYCHGYAFQHYAVMKLFQHCVLSGYYLTMLAPLSSYVWGQ